MFKCTFVLLALLGLLLAGCSDDPTPITTVATPNVSEIRDAQFALLATVDAQAPIGGVGTFTPAPAPVSSAAPTPGGCK